MLQIRIQKLKNYEPGFSRFKKFVLTQTQKELIVYTDGSSRGNPGPGGYGAILQWGNQMKELSGGFKRTTNNRMELMAVIAGLEALKKEGMSITVFSDSQYVVKAVNEG